MADELIFRRVGNAGHVTLNRPQALNALTHAMCRDLHAQLAAWAEDPAVRLVVVDGAGDKAFCAGGDIRAMKQRAQAPAGEVAFNGWARQQRTHKAVSALHAVPKPVIAAVNGPATGLGADLAMCCDFVMASSAATGRS